MPIRESNRRMLEARQSAENFKDRRGGIDPEAWKDISKDERSEMAKAGLVQGGSSNIHAYGTGSQSMAQGDKQRDKWENAAYEHGFGNVRSSDDLRTVFQASKDLGIKNMDSFNDGRAFRRAHNDYDDKRFKAIENQLGGTNTATTTPEAKEPEEQKPVEFSDQYARSKSLVNKQDKAALEGSSPLDNTGNFGTSFMHRYKEGVKENLEPKPFN